MIHGHLPPLSEVVNDITSCYKYSQAELARKAGVGKNALNMAKSKGDKSETSRRDLMRVILGVVGLSCDEYLERKRSNTLRFRAGVCETIDLENALITHSLLGKLEEESYLSCVQHKKKIRTKIQDAMNRIIQAGVLKGFGLRSINPLQSSVMAAESACSVNERREGSFNIKKNIRDSEDVNRDGLVVSVSVDSVGPVAALLGMQKNFQIYGFPIQIRIQGLNGADQVSQMKKTFHETMFAIFGLPSYTLHYGLYDYLPNFQLEIPLFSIEQCILKKQGDLRHVFFCSSGFAELQERAKAGLQNQYKMIRADSITPLSVAPHLENGQGLISFNPLAQRMAHEHQLERIPDSGYRIDVGLFANRNILKECSASRLVGEFVRAFVREYRICTNSRSYSLRLLMNSPEFMEKYCKAVGFPPFVYRHKK